MSKKLSVTQGTFTITDTVSRRTEFQSKASQTYLSKVGSRYYFHYDTFIIGDTIKKSRSVDYPLGVFVGGTGAVFVSEEALQTWVNDNLAVQYSTTPGTPGTAVNTITDHVSEFDPETLYVYSGYRKNTVPYIIRYKDGITTQAAGVTNLTTDWANRALLTYS